MPPQIVPTGYGKLLAAIRTEMAAGIEKAERLLEQQKIRTYWSIGRLIHSYLDENARPRGAVGAFYQKLSRDLDINSRTLQHCEQFFRYFPKLNNTAGLSWSHYRYLLAVPEEKDRLTWISRIRKGSINANELRLSLSESLRDEPESGAALREPVRGKLYTYKLARAGDFEGVEVPWFVDCGFSSRIEAPPADAELDIKRVYVSQKTKDGYRLKVTDTPVDRLYTFKAGVLRVIDGDTLLAAIDQGFGIWTQQRLRLSGIDAPEIDTLRGQKARQYVTQELSGVKFLIIKTYKSDKYDRYLADVFYQPNEPDPHAVAARGRWLNSDLVSRGLAGIWDGGG
ncbi:MAG: DUF1016 N-terminal domain-containing protein [Candidatus Omnitrophota bacterium]|nr:DUF1016 N-terminal domain-containing protein [Candidatus Omnitrophota bacterium]